MREPFCELERACSRLKGRGRATTCALMLRDASQRASALEAPALASRCDAPQHEGRRALRILAKRTQRSFPPNEAKPHSRRPREGHPATLASRGPRCGDPGSLAGVHGSRLSLRSAGTTIRSREGPTFGCTKSPLAPFHCFRLLFTMGFATRTCRSMTQA